MEKDEWLANALKEIMPKRIDSEIIKNSGYDLGLKGKVTAAKALAMALVSKGLEGDMKAFSMIAQLLSEGDSENDIPEENKVIEIRVVE